MQIVLKYSTSPWGPLRNILPGGPLAKPFHMRTCGLMVNFADFLWCCSNSVARVSDMLPLISGVPNRHQNSGAYECVYYWLSCKFRAILELSTYYMSNFVSLFNYTRYTQGFLHSALREFRESNRQKGFSSILEISKI